MNKQLHRIITKGIIGGLTIALIITLIQINTQPSFPKPYPYVPPSEEIPKPPMTIPESTYNVGSTKWIVYRENIQQPFLRRITQPTTPKSIPADRNTEKNDYTEKREDTASHRSTSSNIEENLLDSIIERLSTNPNAYKSYKKEDFEILCSAWNKVCNKIDFRGSIPWTDRVLYLGFMIYLFEFIDNNLERGSITDRFNTLIIDGGKGRRRGLASHTKIILYVGSMQEDREIREVFTHEVGHIIDLGVLVGSSRTLHKKFTEFGTPMFSINDQSISFYEISRKEETIKRLGTNHKDFVSGYGMTNPFEDFAEAFNLYINHNDLFAFYAQDSSEIQEKYDYFTSLLGEKYLFASSRRYAEGKSKRHRDTTRIVKS